MTANVPGPRTERGNRTRTKLLDAAEKVFAELGYHDASIVKLTDAAGVAQGTFYLYFKGKQEIFDELVEDLNRRVRHAMSEASAQGHDRIESERLGFQAFFRFTAEHPALYRIIRQAEFVSPKALRMHYTRIVEGYIAGLDKAKSNGEITDLDTSVAAWALMGIGELVGMRWVLWNEANSDSDVKPMLPEPVFDEVMALIQRALGARASGSDTSESG
ncbi:MAG: TetR/AcrR family transcriptional regulator [Jatrophihabitantaceae bacterium]